MILRHLFCWLVVLGCCAAHAAEPAEPAERITIESVDDRGGGSFDLNTGTAVFTNRAIARYGDTSLTADSLRLVDQSGEAIAEGDVIVLRDGMQLWRGERIVYNFRSRVMSTPAFRAGQPPYFMSGSNLVTIPTNNAYVGTNGTFTTDDRAEPGYRIRAKQIIIVPGQYVEARHAIVYAGKVPVLYFPYFHKAVGRHPNNYEFLAGYRSSWGPFLLNTYNWYWNERLNGSVNLDLRGERGIAGGPDFKWHDPTFGEGMLRYYYAHDIDPEKVFGFKTPDKDRQRVLFQEQLKIRPNLTARSVVAYQSDPFIIRDFFESEYHDNVQPKSFV
jgi:lipopolysaccharide assembly outer membrane protein LptD (OstA)